MVPLFFQPNHHSLLLISLPSLHHLEEGFDDSEMKIFVDAGARFFPVHDYYSCDAFSFFVSELGAAGRFDVEAPGFDAMHKSLQTCKTKSLTQRGSVVYHSLAIETTHRLARTEPLSIFHRALCRVLSMSFHRDVQ